MADQETLVSNPSETDADSGEVTSQATKTYSQEEFDAHMARMKASLTKKLTKQYEDLGDVEQLRQLKTEFEKKQFEEQKKRGEFDNILKEMASKKDAEIQRRDAIIAEYKVDVPLTSAAAKYRAVNAEQVKALLKNNVRLGSEGEVEIVDQRGQPRYKDNGDAFGVDDLVREFLDSNPHFVQATPSTTGTRNSIEPSGSGPVDLSKLDMRRADHREIYARARATQRK